MTIVDLRKWDPASVSDPNVFIVIGKRNTGKSVIIMSIMHAKRHLEAGIVFSGTEAGNKAYGGKDGCVPPEFVFNEFDPRKVEKLLARQVRIMDAGKTPPTVFLVLDDCMYDNKVMKSEIIRFIFLNGRHYKICLIMGVQYLVSLPPWARQNADYVICCREPIIQNKQKLYNFMGGALPSFEQFSALMDQCTNNFECLVINNLARSNDASEVYSYYKGIFPTPRFRMGSAAYWRMATILRTRRKTKKGAAGAGAGTSNVIGHLKIRKV